MAGLTDGLKILDPTTIRLFSPFNRDVGNPSRQRIYYIWQFIRFIDRNDGINDCFASVYPYSLAIDKIFYDLDAHTMVQSRNDAETLYNWLFEMGYPTIPILSGRKGFHIYPLLKPKIYDNPKEALKRATYGILEQAFGTKDDRIKTNTVDPHIIGDVMRLTRIPNTLRPPQNLTFCTYLPTDWTSMSNMELILHMKHPNTYDYAIPNKLPTLEDFPEPQVEQTEWEFDANLLVDQPNGQLTGNNFLKNVLRRCVYRHLIQRNPPDVIRYIATLDGWIN
jgi:hypothetical protein